MLARGMQTRTSQNAESRWRWAGALVGLVVGCGEWAITRAVGISISRNDQEISTEFMIFFVVSYGAVGWLVGRLLEARRQLQRDTETIQQQHEQVLQYEKLASIGKLAAGVAHEVRNSLGVVGSASGLLLESAADASDEQVTAARFIKEEITRLDGFVRSLLDFSKPVAPKGRTFELSSFLHRLNHLANDERVVIETENLEPGLSAFGDPDLLTQALLALIRNGCEAVDTGGRVTLSSRAVGTQLQFEIRDDGPGICMPDSSMNNDSQNRIDSGIFEPFFTTKTEGTGLGLSMAARIVEAHQGSLEHVLGSGLGDAGAGACFRLTLPKQGS